MEEYADLIKLGFVVALVLLIGLILRLLGIVTKKGKKKGKEKGKRKGKKGDKAAVYKSDAYVDLGGDGNTEWQDDDMYAMKEGKSREATNIDGFIEEVKDEEKESWDNY